MFQRMTIGKQLILAFGTVLILLCCVGGISFWCLYKLYIGVQILQVNAKISTCAMRVRSDYANMRRFEKGVFINVDSVQKQDPYLTIWNKMHDDLTNTIVELSKDTSLKEDKDIVASMPQILANYKSGFNQTVAQLRKGDFKDAQHANDAMDKFRWAANELENTGKLLATQTSQRSELSLQSVVDQLKRVVWIISITLLVVFVFSAILAL